MWKEGWRNLHDKETTAISVSLTDDGQPTPTVSPGKWSPQQGPSPLDRDRCYRAASGDPADVCRVAGEHGDLGVR